MRRVVFAGSLVMMSSGLYLSVKMDIVRENGISRARIASGRSMS